MNQCIIDILNNRTKLNKFVKGLPVAFEMASLELPKGNPAVGFLREHAIIGFFINELGSRKVKVPKTGIHRGFDVNICGQNLSIKTVTGNSKFKVLWTVDPYQIGREIESKYQPECDIFLITIHWNKEKDSVFYIPQLVQSEIYKKLSGKKYLKAAVGTNHRGIEITSKAIKELKNHPKTLSYSVNWTKQNLHHNPYKYWQTFWSKR